MNWLLFETLIILATEIYPLAPFVFTLKNPFNLLSFYFFNIHLH